MCHNSSLYVHVPTTTPCARQTTLETEKTSKQFWPTTTTTTTRPPRPQWPQERGGRSDVGRKTSRRRGSIDVKEVKRIPARRSDTNDRVERFLRSEVRPLLSTPSRRCPSSRRSTPSSSRPRGSAVSMAGVGERIRAQKTSDLRTKVGQRRWREQRALRMLQSLSLEPTL